MKATKYVEAKRSLAEKYGEKYPKGRDDLTPRFLIDFGEYVDGPDEEDYEDFFDYEDAKYSSEQWAYFLKLSEAVITKEDGEEAFKAAWSSYLDWLIENYFPELAN